MNTFKTLSYHTLTAMAESIPPTDAEAGTAHFKIRDKEFGAIEQRHIHHPHVTIIEYKADLNGNFRIRHDEEQMLHSMNSCFLLQGSIGLHLRNSNFSTALDPLQHHNIFAPEPEYDLLIGKNAHVFHLAIDREYYAGLLCERERHTARIQQKLLKKEMVWHGPGQVKAGMKQALYDIFHAPVSGKLKSLLIEGKVLELVALQLGQFITIPETCKMTRSDTDVFHEVRQFLDHHFKEELSLKGLSRMFGVNEFKLKKGFKELFHTTIFDYIHDLKMVHARELLLDHKLYVNQVSSRVGYKNPNHFSTAFKRKFGVSPTSLK
jgi:AraC family transcriptional regulator, transcriptional activator of the genes for pyochelin and ferripyochelin receptors